MKEMSVAIIGSDGRLGRALLSAARRAGLDAIGFTHGRIDISSSAALFRELSFVRPHWVINAAALTDVAGAEAPEARYGVMRTNAQGPGVLGEVCRALGASVLHVSSDYVFGSSGEGLLMENDPLAPRGVYACSKAEGERALLRSGVTGAVVRAGWLHSGERDFFRTIVQRAAAGESLTVTRAQVGKPSSYDALAKWIVQGIALGPAKGLDILHYVESGPYVSRYDTAHFALQWLAEADAPRAALWRTALERLEATDALAPEQPANCRLARHASSNFYRLPEAYWPDGVKTSLSRCVTALFGEASAR